MFVSLDIFFQLIFNYDIFGFEPIHPRKLSGPFGPELIAGSYLQKFYLFFIPLILFFSFKKKYNFVILIFIILNLIAIIFSGNRMPLLLSV